MAFQHTAGVMRAACCPCSPRLYRKRPSPLKKAAVRRAGHGGRLSGPLCGSDGGGAAPVSARSAARIPGAAPMLGPPKRRAVDQPVTVTLDSLVPADHFYRHLEATLDLAFVREWVQDCYAARG